MKKSFFCWFVLLFTVFSAAGQKNLYIGLEGGFADDLYKVTEGAASVPLYQTPSGWWGITLRRELSTNLFVETGMIAKKYRVQHGFKPAGLFNSTAFSTLKYRDLMKTTLIPVRLGGKMQLAHKNVHLVPVLGYALGVHHGGSHESWVNEKNLQVSSQDTIQWSASGSFNSSKAFDLFQLGMGFEFKVFKKGLFTISHNYYRGVQPIITYDLRYRYNNGAEERGKFQGKGSFFTSAVSFLYDIGR